MPRKKRIGIRLSDDEYESIRQVAGDQFISEYMRAQSLGRTPRLPRQIPAVNQAAWQDLARCLGNLNQLSRAVHGGDIPADPSTGRILLNRIDELNAEVRNLRNHLIGAAALETSDDRQAS